MNEIETLKCFRLFLAWEDEKEERWLTAMARRGWHMKHYNLRGYTFEKGPPADVAYRLDYQLASRTDQAEYLGLFRDAGWEHVQEFANWHYFRAPFHEGRPPEIFTDNHSKAEKYRRLLTVLVIVLFPNFMGLLTTGRHLPHDQLHSWLAATLSIIFVIQVMVIVLLGYAILCLLRRVRRLQGA